MKRLLPVLRRVVPDYSIIPGIFLVVWQLLIYVGTKLLMQNAHHYNLELPQDQIIPYLPWTVVIYLAAFVFWVVAVVVILRSAKEQAFRFLCADFLTKTVSLMFFLLLPTTNVRPPEQYATIWDWGIRVVHMVDTPTNLFPSLHCVLSWLCAMAIGRETRISRFWKGFCYVSAVLICISTLTTRQHVIVDVISGVALAEITYLLCGSRRVTRFYYSLFDREWSFLKK